MRIDRSTFVDRSWGETRQRLEAMFGAADAYRLSTDVNAKPINAGFNARLGSELSGFATDLTIVNWEPPSHATATFANRHIAGQVRFSAKPARTGTALSAQVEAHLVGAWRLFEPIAAHKVRPVVERGLEDVLRDLKEDLEATEEELERRRQERVRRRHERLHGRQEFAEEDRRLQTESREFKASPWKTFGSAAVLLALAGFCLVVGWNAWTCTGSGCGGSGNTTFGNRVSGPSRPRQTPAHADRPQEHGQSPRRPRLEMAAPDA